MRRFRNANPHWIVFLYCCLLLSLLALFVVILIWIFGPKHAAPLAMIFSGRFSAGKLIILPRLG